MLKYMQYSTCFQARTILRYAINGERLGTFGSSLERDSNSHGGAVWCLDVDWETTNFLSGSADNSVRIWDVDTGKNSRISM